MNFAIMDFFGAGLGICSRVSKIASSWNFWNSSWSLSLSCWRNNSACLLIASLFFISLNFRRVNRPTERDARLWKVLSSQPRIWLMISWICVALRRRLERVSAVVGLLRKFDCQKVWEFQISKFPNDSKLWCSQRLEYRVMWHASHVHVRNREQKMVASEPKYTVTIEIAHHTTVVTMINALGVRCQRLAVLLFSQKGWVKWNSNKPADGLQAVEIGEW